MSCHPPTRQVGPYQSEDGPHDEPTEQLAPADLHVKPYAKRHIKVYADTEGRDPATLRRTVGMEVRNSEATDPGEDLGEGFGGSVDELAWAIDAHEQLGFDDLIVQLEPKTTRSLDRLAEALELRAR